MDKLTKIGVGIVLSLLLAVLVITLPSVQTVLYMVFIGNPSILYWLLIGTVVTGLLYKYQPSIKFSNLPTNLFDGVEISYSHLIVTSILLTLVLALIIGPMVGSLYAHTDRANDIEASATVSDTLPETSEEEVRVLPRSIADEYASSSMQKPQYRLTDSDITKVDGEYVWSYGVVPDAFAVAVTGNQFGSLYTDMGQIEKDVEIREDKFKNGRGQLFTDSYMYRSTLKTPLKLHRWKTTFNSHYDGEAYMAHSTVGHSWKFRLLPLPQPYAVPNHGSVEIMDTDGNIDSLSPEQSTKDARLQGENYYPYEVAMFNINSMKYRNGILNKWFYKDEVLDVAELPEEGNQWPIVVPTSSGDGTELTYFIATEPTGEGSGVFEVWTLDGQTGEMSVKRYNEAQIGPQKAINFVSRQPDVNRLSSAQVVSPIPIVNEDTLYWHTKVVPSSNSGVIYTAFVNANNGDVTIVDTTEKVYKFLSESEIEDINDSDSEQYNGEKTVTVTVVVTNNEGDIVGTREIEIPAGGDAQIEVNNPKSSGQQTATTTEG